MTAWSVHAAALWLWHIPRFFQATLDNDWIHSAQHISFLGTALLFWWSLFYAHGKVRYGASVLYLFTTAVHTSILGALLIFLSTIWYPVYTCHHVQLGTDTSPGHLSTGGGLDHVDSCRARIRKSAGLVSLCRMAASESLGRSDDPILQPKR